MVNKPLSGAFQSGSLHLSPSQTQKGTSLYTSDSALKKRLYPGSKFGSTQELAEGTAGMNAKTYQEIHQQQLRYNQISTEQYQMQQQIIQQAIASKNLPSGQARSLNTSTVAQKSPTSCKNTIPATIQDLIQKQKQRLEYSCEEIKQSLSRLNKWKDTRSGVLQQGLPAGDRQNLSANRAQSYSNQKTMTYLHKKSSSNPDFIVKQLKFDHLAEDRPNSDQYLVNREAQLAPGET